MNIGNALLRKMLGYRAALALLGGRIAEEFNVSFIKGRIG